MMGDQNAVIVAVSSSAGRSLRGLVRVSGSNLRPVLRRLLDYVPSSRLLVGNYIADICLPCLTAFFPGPRSYTGEDVLEMQVPGNPALLERVLHVVLEASRSCGFEVRVAEAGEFTRRAFLAGKIDLVEAEGIAATIGAESDAQLSAAKWLREGQLGGWCEKLMAELGDVLALVEAGIDFSDQDDVELIGREELGKRLGGIGGELRSVLERSRTWRELEALPWVVLLGEANVGKSTLFNRLLGHERAVTSDVAGTTRDVLAESLVVENGKGGQAEVMLVDIAGLGRIESELDEAMQEAAKGAMARAELVLDVCDLTKIVNEKNGGDVEVISATGGGYGDGVGEGVEGALEGNWRGSGGGVGRIKVGTKVDLCDSAEGVDISVSGVTGEGVDELREMIGEKLSERAVTVAGEVMALQDRHSDAIHGALVAIEEAFRLTKEVMTEVDGWGVADVDNGGGGGGGIGGGVELVAERMREALDRLGELGGEMTPDDVIGRVFARFCVGK